MKRLKRKYRPMHFYKWAETTGGIRAGTEIAEACDINELVITDNQQAAGRIALDRYHEYVCAHIAEIMAQKGK